MTFTVQSVPLTVRLETDLRAARAHLVVLEAQRGQFALDIIDGAPDAEAKLQLWRQEIAAAREVVADLQAALSAAGMRAEREQRASIAKVRGSQVASIRQRLGAQQKAVIRLAAAIENMSNAWSEVTTQASEIRGTADSAGISLPLEYALTNPGRLRIWARVELWRANKTRRDSSGLYPDAFLNLNEGENLARGLAVEGNTDLAWGDPAKAISLTQRLDTERKQLLDFIVGAPLPSTLTDAFDPFTGTAPVPEPVTFDGPVPISAFKFPPDFPGIETGNGTPITAETKPLVPLDVTMPGDEIDAMLLRQLDEAVAAKGKPQPESKS